MDRGGKLRQRGSPVRRLSVGPGGHVGKVSNHLDPRRSPAHLGERAADQVSLVHRRAEQGGEVATRGSQEPAGRLQHRQAGPGLQLKRHPVRGSDITHQGDPGPRPGGQDRGRGVAI